MSNPAASSPRLQRMGIVSPMANEEANVDEFLQRVTKQLAPADRLFCVLDKVSKDRTRQKIEEFFRHDARVTLVWAPENRSVVDAYFRGYREALNQGCDWILEMDAGLSHSPEEIPRFVQAMLTGVDFAAGSRFMSGSNYSGRAGRYLVSKGGTFLSNRLLGTRMHDMTSGFECFSRAAMEHVLKRGVRSRAHFFQTEIRFMMRHWNWVEVPISYCNPSKSLGSAPLKEAFVNLYHLCRDARNPLLDMRAA